LISSTLYHLRRSSGKPRANRSGFLAVVHYISGHSGIRPNPKQHLGIGCYHHMKSRSLIRMPKTTTKPDNTELSADDLAIWAAVILIIGDLFGLFAVIKAKSEKEELL
jgi:hypothetical protein